MGFDFKWNSDVMLIISKNGHGKTSLAINLIQSLGLNKSQVIALDPNNQFGKVATQIIPSEHDIGTLDKFCEAVMRFPDHMVVADDIDVFEITGQKTSKKFHSLVVMQRHLHLSLVVISRRCLGLDKALISNARYLAFSGLIPSEDMDYLRKQNVTIDRDLINEKTKEPYNFLIYDQQENKYYLYKTKPVE